MKISVLISTLAVLTVLVATPHVYAKGKPAPYEPVSDGEYKVVIDAGHGGYDPGTTQCPNLNESDANLDIAFKLKEKLESSDVQVYMTREDDVYMTNEDRYTYAQGTDADVLVSIHLNGNVDHSVNGTQGLYSKPRKDKEFTSVVHSGMSDDLDVPDLGITNFMSGVTLRFPRPATMVEAVYLSNTDECEALKNGNRADEIADAIYNGLMKWNNE